MIAERLLYFQNIESLYKKKKKKVPASLSSRWENSHRDDKLKKNYLLASNVCSIFRILNRCIKKKKKRYLLLYHRGGKIPTVTIS